MKFMGLYFEKSAGVISACAAVMLAMVMGVSLLGGCVTIAPNDDGSTPTPSGFGVFVGATPTPGQGPGQGSGQGPGGGGVPGGGTTTDDGTKVSPSNPPPKDKEPEPDDPNKPEPEPEEEPGRSKVGASPKIIDIQYNWRIVGEGEKFFTTAGIPGQNKMIVKIDVTKQGGTTPAGTYTGSFSLWYYEMTPEMMKQYGITGDSHNEYKTDGFTVEIIPWTHNKQWPYQAARTTKSITLTSVTDVTIQGHKQQVTDYPSAVLGYSMITNPDSGKAEMVMTLGMPESFVFSDFRIEKN